MKKDVFGEGTYWYKVISRYGSEYDAEFERIRKRCIDMFDGITDEGLLMWENEMLKPNSRSSLFSWPNVGDALADKYIHPLVLFVKDGKLVVAVNVSYEYEKGDTPHVNIWDCMFYTAIPRESIGDEIEKRLGIKPKELRLCGSIDLEYDGVSIDGLYERDFCPDEEEREELGDALLGTLFIDVLVCTDWDGEFKFEEDEDGDKYMPASIGLNELDKYGLDALVKHFGHSENYHVWATLLYHAGVLDKA